MRSVGTDDTALVGRLQALQHEFDSHWSAVRAAAAAIDETSSQPADVPASSSGGAPSSETAALLEQREHLRTALADRNRTLKQQIDQLRQTLVSIEVMDPAEGCS